MEHLIAKSRMRLGTLLSPGPRGQSRHHPAAPPPCSLPVRWHHALARLRARDIFLMVPLPALLAALLACQLAGVVLCRCRQLGRGFMGMWGLGALRTGGRASPARSPRSPLLLSRTQGTFWVPTQGKGMWKAVTGEFLIPRACKAAQLSEMRWGNILQRCCREVSLGLWITLGFSCSWMQFE